MGRLINIEGIPSPATRIYSLFVAKSPVMKDLYSQVADEVCGKISHGKILDVGTGPGYVPFEIAKRAPGLKITGVDISYDMVRIARENAAKRGMPMDFQYASAEDLPFGDHHFDLVFSTFSLHHWLKPVEYLKEIYRVLKYGGEAWIYDARRDTAKDVDAMARKKYGPLLSFIFLNIVRAHSSITMQQAQDIISSPELVFSEKKVVDRGVLLKLQLKK